MTAAETVAKAIEKLDVLKGRRGDRWELLGGGEWISPIGVTVAPDDGGVSPRVAELIVTLHRTIDPQLAILRAGLPDPAEAFSEAGQAYHAVATILAEAILGGDL